MWCPIIRRLMEWKLDSDRPLGPLARRHLDACAPCREHFRIQASLAARLKRESAGVPAPPELKRRLLRAALAQAATRSLRPVPAPRSAAAFRAALAGTFVAAGVLLAVTALMIRSPRPERPTVVSGQALPANPASLDAIGGSRQAAEQSTRMLDELARELIGAELDNLARDARDIGQAVLASLPLDLSIGSPPAGGKNGN